MLWKADAPSASPGVDAGTEAVLSEMCHASFVRETEPQFESFDSTICDLLRPATCPGTFGKAHASAETQEYRWHLLAGRSTICQQLAAHGSASFPHTVFPHHSTFEHFEH